MSPSKPNYANEEIKLIKAFRKTIACNPAYIEVKGEQRPIKQPEK